MGNKLYSVLLGGSFLSGCLAVLFDADHLPQALNIYESGRCLHPLSLGITFLIGLYLTLGLRW